MLPDSDIPPYNLLGPNIKIPLCRRILEKETGLHYGEQEQTLTYMLQNNDTEF